MSSTGALATVTATLQNLIMSIAGGATVSTQSPGVARTTVGTGQQLNIFLYAIHQNSALRNAPMPHTNRSGDFGHPPLSLVLNYLITSFGDNDDDISGQELLGQAMLLLHDHPVLSRADIEGIAPDSNLHLQIENLRITPLPLTMDEMSRLWAGFPSTEYRLSTAYEVSVVLIESGRDGKTPLPVLRRGETDRGPSVVATPNANLHGVRFVNHKPSAELGDQIVLLGENLTAENSIVQWRHPLLTTPLELTPESDVSPNELPLDLPNLSDSPNLASEWPAGFYQINIKYQQAGQPSWVSNSVSVPISPRIVSRSPANAAAGTVVITIECLPQILPDQEVSLLFAERRLIPDSITTPPADPAAVTTAVFTVNNIIARDEPYVLRLRVDGVDSIPVDFSGSVPQFDNNQMVAIS